jgi:hypothetical protein
MPKGYLERRPASGAAADERKRAKASARQGLVWEADRERHPEAISIFFQNKTARSVFLQGCFEYQINSLSENFFSKFSGS